MNAIPEHELDPEPDCPCFWCEETREEDNFPVRLRPDGAEQETVTMHFLIPGGGYSIERPAWCPECESHIDDPESCWNCGFSFVPICPTCGDSDPYSDDMLTEYEKLAGSSRRCLNCDRKED